MMKKFLLIICVLTIVTARAQFVVEKQDGSPVTVEGNLHFAKDATGENWSVGETYDPAMDLSQIKGIEAQKDEGDSFAGKTCWVYGVKAPDFPGKENVKTYSLVVSTFPAGEWLRYDYEGMGVDYEIQQFTWSDTCAWYDCNKTYEFDDAPDFSMCWAATASNLLHWCLVNNKEYVDRYDKKYGQPYDFARPSEVYKAPNLGDYASNKSEIFKFFISTFQDRSGWEGAGVNWFINGNSTNISAPFRDPDMAINFHGFFSDVFSSQDVIAEESRDMSKENFKKLIKQALTENKAIGFSAYKFAAGGDGLHAMTIWGVEFDEEGYVSHIYYCDNNLVDQDANGAAIIRLGITYDENPAIPSMGDVAYTIQLPKPFGGSQRTSLITALVLVDLRQDIWKQTFGDVE